MTVTATSIETIAEGVKNLVAKQAYEEAYRTYFVPNAISAEAMAGPDGSRECQGMEAIQQKGEQWQAMMETHAVEVSEPLIAENFFALRYRFDVTQRQTGNRFWMEEMAVYTVKDGKIVREEFFYSRSKN
jgi:hypothetical protein